MSMITDGCANCVVNKCERQILDLVRPAPCFSRLLMSYSGEWIFSIRKSLGKTSSNLQSPTFTRSRTHPVRCAHFHRIDSTMASNSDLEADRMLPTPPAEHPRYSCQSASPPAHATKFFPLTNRTSRIIVQSSIDEQRLKSMQENARTRPSELFQSQPLVRKECNYISISHLNNTSDDEQSMAKTNYDRQSPPPPPPTTPAPSPAALMKTKRVITLKAMHNSQINKTIAGVEPPERGRNDLSADWTVEKYKSNRRRAKIQRNCHSASRKRRSSPERSIASLRFSSGDSNQDLSSNPGDQSVRKRLSVSMQSLRDIVYRVPRRSQSPTEQVPVTTTTERTSKSESSSGKEQDHLSLKIPKLASRSSKLPSVLFTNSDVV